MDVWQTNEDGFYDVQYTDGRVAARAHLFTDDEGRYAFWGTTPPPYPIPHDGPVGDLLGSAHCGCGPRLQAALERRGLGVRRLDDVARSVDSVRRAAAGV